MLADGRVLVAGGVDTKVGDTAVTSAWLFDPATKRFVPTGAMNAARVAPLTATLSDGRILVIGGWHAESTGEQVSMSTAELYDPATGTFAPTAGLPDDRRDCPCGALNSRPMGFATRDGAP